MKSSALLYAIIDLGYVHDDRVLPMLAAVIEGGADIVQLRGKDRSLEELSAIAEPLLKLAASAKIPVIVNDHAEIANRVEVDGVHVGQDDDAISKVRAAVRRPIIVGKSTHSIGQALAAEKEGADYLGFGPIFATATKPDYKPIGLKDIREVHRGVSLPIFCIGGIKMENLPEVVAAGAKRVAIVSGLFQSNDPTKYAREAKSLLIRKPTIGNRKSE